MQDNPASSPTVASDPDDPLIGTIIGDRYRVEGELGSGGMGTVYRAEHVLMEKRVALKVLHPSLAVVGSVMDRFQREAVALSRIEHPNVVSATDFGKLKNGSFYLALEYVDGKNLAETLQLEGRFDVRRALVIAGQVAQALAAAHGHGIVHRDLKPHNVMLTSGAGGTEVVKVLDFGLAKLRSKTIEGSTANIGSVFGTPHYMAPEQVASTNVDGRADLYSLGVILYEMLSGRRPFDAESPNQVLDLQLSQPPPPLPEHLPEVVRALVADLLQKQPEFRPPSAEQVHARIEDLLHPQAPPAAEPWLQEEVRVGALTLPRWALVLPGVVFVAIFGIGVFLSRDDAQPSNTVMATVTPPPPLETTLKPDSPEPNRWPQLIAQAEFGDEVALSELLAIPAEQRDKEVWVVLGQGLVKAGKANEAITLYAEALEQQPDLQQDESIAKSVRELASAEDPKTAQAALNLSASHFGSRGVDILFSVWSETKKRTPETALADRHLEQPEVLKHASKAVTLALELRKPDLQCERAKTLLEQAKEVGDTRSLRPMARFRKLRGCGPAKRDDCYSCLRNSTLLEDAIREANRRTAPRY